MCLIVDANLASQVFASPPDPDFAPILDWLQGDGRLVFGGPLAAELGRVEKARRFLLELVRAGRARRVADEAMQPKLKELEETGLCRSNDAHVVALAQVSGARTLCTHDKALQQDFRDRRLVANPRGSIYQRREHARLLQHTPSSCGIRRER